MQMNSYKFRLIRKGIKIDSIRVPAYDSGDAEAIAEAILYRSGVIQEGDLLELENEASC